MLHILFHILGRYHEHQRQDRDQYITINWENVQIGKIKPLQKNTGFTNKYNINHAVHFSAFSLSLHPSVPPSLHSSLPYFIPPSLHPFIPPSSLPPSIPPSVPSFSLYSSLVLLVHYLHEWFDCRIRMAICHSGDKLINTRTSIWFQLCDALGFQCFCKISFWVNDCAIRRQ